jgi:hypothetical protein
MLNLLWILSFLVLLAFALPMILLPNSTLTEKWLRTYGGFVALGVMYVLAALGAILSNIGIVSIDLSSAPAFAKMVSTPSFAMFIWLHLVIADLAALYWIRLEAPKLGLKPFTTRAFLLLVLLIAPLGLFAFAMFQVLKRSQAATEASLKELANASVSAPTNSETAPAKS